MVICLPLIISGCSGGTSSNSTPQTTTYATTTTLTSTSNTLVVGASVTLTATVTSSGGAPTGTVNFLDSGATLGSGTLSNGMATFTTTALATGTHSITASYAGASTFTASASVAYTVTVTAAPLNATATTLMAAPNPVVVGTTVMLTANVTSTAGTPTGTVTFYSGSASLGTASLSSGSAILSVPGSTFAANSTQSIYASYAGVAASGASAGYASSMSMTTSLAVLSTAPPATINAHATFSFTTPNQTIAGFGGAEAFDLTYLDSNPYSSDIYTALFDPTQGLGLSFLRVQNIYYNYNGSNASSFDTDTPKIVAAAKAKNSSLKLLMSAWTPPASLKSNASIEGCTGVTNGSCTSGIGTLAQASGGGYNYAGFGQFWASSLSAYAALGVTPDYISIQNEPDYAATYVGCRFNPTEAALYGSSYASYGKAFDAVYQSLKTSGLSSVPQMVGPEVFTTADTVSWLTDVPSAPEVNVVAHHGYNVSSYGGNPDSAISTDTSYNTALASGAYASTPRWESEYYQTPGFNTAWNIHNDLTLANDNVYMYWQLTWPSTLANGVSTDQQGLLYVDNPYTPSSWAFPHGWTYNDAYYAFKHFSFFVKPGYVRYNATVDNTDERVSVYQSTDKKTTIIVALNTSTTSDDGFLPNLSGITYTNATVYRSSFGQPIASGERFANLGSLYSGGIDMQPQSVVTIVLTN